MTILRATRRGRLPVAEAEAPTLAQTLQGYADAAWKAQRGTDWQGKRVRRLEALLDVLEDGGGEGKVRTRDAHTGVSRTWARREFLSRGLEVVDRPGG